jgi:segregation and condensation protein A
MMAQLRAQLLTGEGPVSLVEFFEACPSRHAMIVAFLAVLEMVRLQAVLLVQEKQFSDILVRKHKMFDVVFAEDGTIREIDEQYQ